MRAEIPDYIAQSPRQVQGAESMTRAAIYARMGTDKQSADSLTSNADLPRVTVELDPFRGGLVYRVVQPTPPRILAEADARRAEE